MIFNRYFYFLIMSVFFIGVIFWWQTPNGTVSAIVNGKYPSSNSYNTVKNYWNYMDYRQFELALEMLGDKAKEEHKSLENALKKNPFLSIQNVTIKSSSEQNEFIVKVVFSSTINNKEEINYLFVLEPVQNSWQISSINII